MLVVRDLRVGGAERVMVRLANYAAGQGVSTHLVALVGGGPLESEVDPGVQFHNLASERIRSAAIPFLKLVERLGPQAVMSTIPQANALTVLVTRFMARRPRVVLREANDPRHEMPFSRKFLAVKRRLLGAIYRRADAVVAVSSGVKTGVEEALGVLPAKIVTIANASLDDTIYLRARERVADEWYEALEARIVCVARFTEQKDHATLLAAFNSLNDMRKAGLVLIGHGPLEPALRASIEAMHLTQRVKLVTDEQNPFRWMSSANVVVLSSRWEGSPNVLIEAMALGTPVVSTDCPSGPSELLLGGRLGPLVPVGDAAAMAQAIRATLENPTPSADLEARAREFHIHSVGPRWLEVALGS